MIRNETSISKEDRIGVNIIIDSVDFEFPAMMDFITRFHFNCIFSLSKNILKEKASTKCSRACTRYLHCREVSGDTIIVYLFLLMEQLMNCRPWRP